MSNNKPNPPNSSWRRNTKIQDSWVVSPLGAFTPPVGPVDTPFLYSDDTPFLYSDSTPVYYD